MTTWNLQKRETAATDVVLATILGRANQNVGGKDGNNGCKHRQFSIIVRRAWTSPKVYPYDSWVSYIIIMGNTLAFT